MASRLALESERIGRTGGITGSGARRVLGAPRIESLEVVIREAVQNSWDAAETQDPGIQFGVNGFELREQQKDALMDALRDGLGASDPIVPLPERGPIDGLLIWDRGTSGLGGALRPDEEVGGERDFVRFVYMIGDTKVQTGAFAKGGTYGFGRSSFITASRASTILVHTRCLLDDEKTAQSRFIGMTWTNPDRQGANRFTGRHWWGAPERGGHVSALLDGAADTMARSLGMNPSKARELGTSILILTPRWVASDGELDGDLDSARGRALAQIKQGLMWNCWPRLLDRSISASIRWFGDEVEIPDPSKEARLRPFTQAYEIIRAGQAPRGMFHTSLQCLKPRKDLGTLALVKSPFVATGYAVDEEEALDADEVRDANRPLHHVALMRGTKLVIRYHAASSPPEGLQYAGVFLADPALDQVYAASEPPAHDEWVRSQLTDSQHRTFISVTFRRINEHVAAYLSPLEAGRDPADSAEDLGLMSDQLGTLLLDVEGEGAGSLPENPARGAGSERGGGGGRKSFRVDVLAPERIAREGGVELQVPVKVVAGSSRSRKVTLTARTIVIVAGGSEKEPPAGAPVPRVIGWQSGRDAMLVKKSAIAVDVDGERECLLSVFQPSDCFVKIVVDAE